MKIIIIVKQKNGNYYFMVESFKGGYYENNADYTRGSTFIELRQ